MRAFVTGARDSWETIWFVRFCRPATRCGPWLGLKKGAPGTRRRNGSHYCRRRP
jgi:hypothetical protein